MCAFKNFATDGFTKVSWMEYMEGMIDMGPVYIKTRMPAPKAFIIGNQTLLDELKARNDTKGSRIRIELSNKLGN